jgi:hypothetical protein
MQENLKDILSSLSTEIDQQTLLLYLQGKLTDDKKHEVEKHLIDHDFDEEAMQGLQQIHDKEQILFMVEMLNRDLKKKTEKKRKRSQKMRFRDQPWLWISILILILLIVLSYIVIFRLMKE